MGRACAPEAVEYPGGVPATWRVTVRCALKQDGSPLVYYDFVPSPDVREVVLGPTDHHQRHQH